MSWPPSAFSYISCCITTELGSISYSSPASNSPSLCKNVSIRFLHIMFWMTDFSTPALLLPSIAAAIMQVPVPLQILNTHPWFGVHGRIMKWHSSMLFCVRFTFLPRSPHSIVSNFGLIYLDFFSGVGKKKINLPLRWPTASLATMILLLFFIFSTTKD